MSKERSDINPHSIMIDNGDLRAVCKFLREILRKPPVKLDENHACHPSHHMLRQRTCPRPNLHHSITLFKVKLIHDPLGSILIDEEILP